MLGVSGCHADLASSCSQDPRLIESLVDSSIRLSISGRYGTCRSGPTGARFALVYQATELTRGGMKFHAGLTPLPLSNQLPLLMCGVCTGRLSVGADAGWSLQGGRILVTGESE